MLAKHDTSFFTKGKDQNVHSVLLFSVHLQLFTPREFTVSIQLFRWEKDWSLESHSVKV